MKQIQRRANNLIPLIIDTANMDDALDEVVSDMPKEERERYQRKREQIRNKLVPLIVSGEFRVTRFEEFEVKDGPKTRKVQSPPVIERVGVNAIMRVVERFVYPTIIRTSAARCLEMAKYVIFLLNGDQSNGENLWRTRGAEQLDEGRAQGV